MCVFFSAAVLLWLFRNNCKCFSNCISSRLEHLRMHAVQLADLCFPPIAKYSLNCFLSLLLLEDLNYFLIVHISSFSLSLFLSGWLMTDHQREVQDLCHLGVIINFLLPMRWRHKNVSVCDLISLLGYFLELKKISHIPSREPILCSCF